MGLADRIRDRQAGRESVEDVHTPLPGERARVAATLTPYVKAIEAAVADWAQVPEFAEMFGGAHPRFEPDASGALWLSTGGDEPDLDSRMTVQIGLELGTSGAVVIATRLLRPSEFPMSTNQTFNPASPS